MNKDKKYIKKINVCVLSSFLRGRRAVGEVGGHNTKVYVYSMFCTTKCKSLRKI